MARVSSISAINYVPTPTSYAVAKRPSTANVSGTVQVSSTPRVAATPNVASTAKATSTAKVANELQIAQANQNKNPKIANEESKDSVKVSKEAMELYNAEKSKEKQSNKICNNDTMPQQNINADKVEGNKNGCVMPKKPDVEKFGFNEGSNDKKIGNEYKKLDKNTNYGENDSKPIDDEYKKLDKNTNYGENDSVTEHIAINGNDQKPSDNYYPDMDRRGGVGTQTAEIDNKKVGTGTSKEDCVNKQISQASSTPKDKAIPFDKTNNSKYGQTTLDSGEKLTKVTSLLSRFATRRAYC